MTRPVRAPRHCRPSFDNWLPAKTGIQAHARTRSHENRRDPRGGCSALRSTVTALAPCRLDSCNCSPCKNCAILVYLAGNAQRFYKDFERPPEERDGRAIRGGAGAGQEERRRGLRRRRGGRLTAEMDGPDPIRRYRGASSGKPIGRKGAQRLCSFRYRRRPIARYTLPE